MSPPHALWVSTGLSTRGGVAACVRTLLDTPLRETWSVEHVATHRNGSTPVKILAFAQGLMRFAAALTRRPVVVHIHMSANGSFVRKAVLAWLTYTVRIPVVLHVHGGDFLIFHERVARPVQRLIEATLSRASTVIALGGQWAERLQTIAPGAAVVVVPNAVRPDEAVTQEADGESVHVVFIGDIIEAKGVFTLLEAWVGVGLNKSRCRLTLAGTGELARAQARAAELGIEANTTFLGWVNPTEIPALLRGAHVLALPSQFEGQPMVVLEAMAKGLCVVASDVGGIPDLIDSECGVLVSADDVESLSAALKRVIEDGQTRAALGAAALARVRREFDVDVVWRRIDEIYRSVVSRVDRPRARGWRSRRSLPEPVRPAGQSEPGRGEGQAVGRRHRQSTRGEPMCGHRL
jgi:glycosyltransferase involved in cell wall biosynthesis